MATAYASLVSVIHVINRIQLPSCPVPFDDKLQIQSLYDKVTFLIDFLEEEDVHRINEKTEGLERRITDAAYTAEDVIESFVVQQVLEKSGPFGRLEEVGFSEKRLVVEIKQRKRANAYRPFYEDLQSTIQELSVIIEELMKIKRNRLLRCSTSPVRAQMPSFNNTIVGFDDDLICLMGMLSTDGCSRQIISIVGMGGTGKTTLAANVHNHPFIVNHFHVRAWITISQNYSKREIILCLLREVTANVDKKSQADTKGLVDTLDYEEVSQGDTEMGGVSMNIGETNQEKSEGLGENFEEDVISQVDSEWSEENFLKDETSQAESLRGDLDEDELVQVDSEELYNSIFVHVDKMSEMDTEKLGETLYKSLIGRKYLITLDDIWSMVAWEEMKRFFPDNNNGSRILVTTRLSNVASSIGSCSPYQMRFLDEDTTWDLLSNIVFGSYACLPGLEKIGRRIGKSCKGLPLAIVLIGGLLKKSCMTHAYWENVAENIVSVINTENDENCLKLLALSYSYLPIHLKPCFLYMSIFREDSEILISRLIKLWVADGFLKPSIDKPLEQVAFEYLNDLVDRNLIMVGKQGSRGNIKTCMIHDLLRDLCLREAHKEGFLCVLKEGMTDLPQGTITGRRIVVNHRSIDVHPQHCARSVIYNVDAVTPKFTHGCTLRILGGYHNYSLGDDVKLINARYIEFVQELYLQQRSTFSSISLFWNLETFIFDNTYSGITFTLPSEIWKVSNLRHLAVSPKVILPDPVGAESSGEISCVLSNLQTLSVISNFTCSNEALIRIPNLKKLGLHYGLKKLPKDVSLTLCFTNLLHLHKLEKLKCVFERDAHFDKCAFDELNTLTLPLNLRDLNLSGSCISWENMTIVGSLPNLEVLKLGSHAFCGREWSPIEGEFERLKHLSISGCNLITWRADNLHFPRLQRLNLQAMSHLEEIPCGIGDITSLQSIRLYDCSKPVVESAKEIHEEQQNSGNNDLLVQVIVASCLEKQQLQSLVNDKFQVLLEMDFSKDKDQKLTKKLVRTMSI